MSSQTDNHKNVIKLTSVVYINQCDKSVTYKNWVTKKKKNKKPVKLYLFEFSL